MLESILRHFPPDTHALTLVSDPDGLLNNEALLTELSKRGFSLIQEADPIRLSHRYSQVTHPVIIITSGALDQLPYDLWSTSHHVQLALHTFFPNLAYPPLQALTPSQRAQLAQAPPPIHHLSSQRTIEYLLKYVFGLDVAALDDPFQLVIWLGGRDRQTETLPRPLAQHLLAHLRTISAYDDWPLDEFIHTPQAFRDFLNQQWLAFLENQSGHKSNEVQAPYLVHFEDAEPLQDMLPGWVRNGLLTPVEISTNIRLPDWVLAGVQFPDVDPRPGRYADLIAAIEESISSDISAARWLDWQLLAWDWAELTSLHQASDLQLSEDQSKAYHSLQKQVNDAFLSWLQTHYTPLAGQRLPQPHHVHHVPHCLAFQRRQAKIDKLALLVMDGMSLVDWFIIQSVWRSHHPDWLFDESLLLAQIPSLTAVSRQALVSGMLPVDFAATIDHNRTEAKHWENFWAAEDVPDTACQYERLKLGQYPSAANLLNPRAQVLCLIDNTLDNIHHKALLGAREDQNSLHLWLDDLAPKLEDFIAGLLQTGFVVYLTSDHGHTEAQGFGQPSEGIIVQTRSKRARIYNDERLMNSVRAGYPETIVWQGDGLLPDDLWVMIPREQYAFAPHGEIYVTHGGLSIDEMIVPFIEITSQEE